MLYNLILKNALCGDFVGSAVSYSLQFSMLYFVCFQSSESPDLRPLFVFASAVLLCLAYAIIIFDPLSLDKTNNLAILDGCISNSRTDYSALKAS